MIKRMPTISTTVPFFPLLAGDCGAGVTLGGTAVMLGITAVSVIVGRMSGGWVIGAVDVIVGAGVAEGVEDGVADGLVVVPDRDLVWVGIFFGVVVGRAAVGRMGVSKLVGVDELGISLGILVGVAAIGVLVAVFLIRVGTV
jgi:hypothetical protein